MKDGVDQVELREVIHAVVTEVLDEVDRRRAESDDRLGYTEPEAATLLGVAPHVLRDCRLRGQIAAVRVGKRYVYSRDALLALLNAQDYEG